MKFRFLLCLLGASLTASAWADDVISKPETSNDPAREIAAAIQEQQSRRSGGITATVIGVVSIVGGIIVSAVKTDEKQQEANDRAYQSGTYNYETVDPDVTAALIGLAIGVPCIVGGVRSIVGSAREIRRLQRKRSGLSYAPDSDTLKYTLAFEF